MKVLTYIPLFLSLFLFAACEQQITIVSPNVERFVVVNSNFSPLEPFEIQLDYSKNILGNSNESTAIVDADVKIYNDQGDWLIDFYHAGNGKYFNLDETKPYENQVYRLEVKVDGYPTITAESRVPTKAEIVNLTTTVITQNNDSRVVVDFDINDTEEEDNYYIWEVVNKDVDEENPTTSTTAFNVQGMQANGDGESVQNTGTWSKLFAQEMDFIRSLSAVALVGTTSSATGDSGGGSQETPNLVDDLELKVISASSEYYEYFLSLEIIRNSDGFNGSASIPLEVEGNIVGGLGVFAGYNVQWESLK